MHPTEITEGLPYELRIQLLPNEKIFYFSHISFTGGCLSVKQGEKYWIALSNKRVIYKAKVVDTYITNQHLGNRMYIEKDGTLPFDKISFVEVSESPALKGCSSSKSNELRISTSGGGVVIPLPSKEKGYEIRKILAGLNDHNL